MKMLRQLLPSDIIETSGNLDVSVDAVTCDSRQVKGQTLFVALPGANVDGHTFVADAIRNGACAILSEHALTDLPVPVIRVANSRLALSELADRFYDSPSKQVCLIGVTGTKGKTTTSYMVQSILGKAFGGKAFRFGTVEHDLGSVVKPAKNTTPESLELMSHMHEALLAGVKAGVMEVSSHALKSHRVENLYFSAVGFTNLSMEHTEFHPTMEDYFQAKSRLFLEVLTKGKTAVINLETPYGARLVEACRKKSIPVIQIDLHDSRADFSVKDMQISGTDSRFQIVAEGQSRPCRIRLPGHFNVCNALMAAALTRAVGVDWKHIISGLEDLPSVPGRFEAIENSRGIAIIVDYAHSPAALENVIKAVKPLADKKGRVITVFGCGGNRSTEKRPVMGKLSAELSDITVVTSDNPRKESPDAIIEQIMAGVNSVTQDRRGEIHVEPDRRKAIQLAVSLAHQGDVILIAGKGHETGQTFADRTVPFDDRLIASEIAGPGRDWTLSDVLAGCRGTHKGGTARPIKGFSIDTRTLLAGEVYIAIKGENHDGHDFIAKALEKKAGAIIASSFPGGQPKPGDPPWIKLDDPLTGLQNLARWHRNRHPALFLGVTGSNGKTTTKEMLAHLFSGDQATWATAGNLNNHIGLPLNLVRIPLSAKVAIIEMGMNHAGEIRFLAEIAKPTSALISNIGPAHIGMLGSLEKIALAKAEILENLDKTGFAVLPGDDPFFHTLKSKTRAAAISFGFSPSNDFAGTDLQVKPFGLDMKVGCRASTLQNSSIHGEPTSSGPSAGLLTEGRMRLNLLGKHNASNALAALALFVAHGGDINTGLERLATFKPVTARMESVEIDGLRVVLDCYNANPASMEKALEFLAICPGRRIAVLGDMRELGSGGEDLHHHLGKKVAEAKIDHLVAVGELSLKISEGALTNGMPPQAVHSCRNTTEAAKTLSLVISKGDTILLKASRGMHFEKIVQELWPKIACELH